MMVQNFPEKKKKKWKGPSGDVLDGQKGCGLAQTARPRAHAYNIYLYKRRARGASPAVGPLSYISGTSACRGPSAAAAAAVMQIGINHFIRS